MFAELKPRDDVDIGTVLSLKITIEIKTFNNPRLPDFY